MKRHTFASGYDIVMAVLCIVFLLLSLGSVGSAGRTRAKDFLCRSHLQRWASIFDSSTQDNDGFFPALEPAESGRWWLEGLWPYHKEAGLLACPAAMDPSSDVPTTHRAWRIGERTGSYGLSGWIGKRDQDVIGGRHAYAMYTWQTPRVWGASTIPVLADMFWADAWPYASDRPLATEQLVDIQSCTEMQLVCVNRHAGSVNCLFAEGSVRKVGLKEIWALKWSKTYNPRGPWTTAGGVRPDDWPEWMWQFKDFYEPGLDENP
jgi:hypothetical protein